MRRDRHTTTPDTLCADEGDMVLSAPPPTPEHLLYVDDILQVTCTVKAGPSVINLIGEIDSSNSGEVLRTLTEARYIDDQLIIDVSGVTFADVSAVRALQSFASGGSATIRNAQPQLNRLAGLLGLTLFD
ncbi:STAS domain-containing protein [Nonomuraea deserti]|uniref:STAS domain-containing protein n=1 Tax=Nonomuraea deserti TaxID=1848322 RepID=UPI001404832F|nr:STAS domain-containing protein [Nonomuraea deserti]